MRLRGWFSFISLPWRIGILLFLLMIIVVGGLILVDLLDSDENVSPTNDRVFSPGEAIGLVRNYLSILPSRNSDKSCLGRLTYLETYGAVGAINFKEHYLSNGIWRVDTFGAYGGFWKVYEGSLTVDPVLMPSPCS